MFMKLEREKFINVQKMVVIILVELKYVLTDINILYMELDKEKFINVQNLIVLLPPNIV